MSSVIEFRAVRQPSSTADTDLIDVDLTSAFNRAANSARLRFIDTAGTKVDDYPPAQRVQIQHSTDGGQNWTTRLEGFAAERTRTSGDGFPELSVRVLPYSNLLRRRPIYKTYSSSTISTILQDLIETFTAVTWNASNVTVVNDKTITREFLGERPDEAIAYLASISGDEEWFVNDSLEFVFQPQDTTTAAAIGDDDLIRHDFPKDATSALNRYELFYNTGGNEDRLIVEDLPVQDTYKDRLNAPRAVKWGESDTLTEITDRDRAEEIARQRLDANVDLLTGTVTLPLGRFDTSVGDVLNLTVTEAGISGVDFRVAGIQYRWQAGETTLTLAENVDFVDDVLVRLSDSLGNVRDRDADTTATATQFLDVRSGVTLSLDATLTTKTAGSGFTLGQSQLGQGTGDQLGGSVSATASVSVETKKATKALLNLCRDLWQDGNSEFVDQTHLGVGTDGTTVTRGDTALGSAVDREAVEKFGAGSSSVKWEYTATIPAGGVYAESADLKEFGIFDADSGGNLYTRVTFADTTIDASTRLKLRLEVTVDTDSDLQGGTTTTGQERLVDLVLGESGHEPTDMVYGTGTTAFTEGDTALGSKSHEDTIDSTADRSTGVTDIVEEITSGDADTTNFSEIGTENAGDELLMRATFAAIPDDRVVVSNYRWQASNA